MSATLAGRKTMTRRVMTPQPPEWIREFGYTAFTPKGSISGRGVFGEEGPAEKFFRSPYGLTGDRLWVREAWASVVRRDIPNLGARPIYATSAVNGACEVLYRETDDDGLTQQGFRWRSPRFMPRWASRLSLELTGVRVERVQDGGEEDAEAEGVCRASGGCCAKCNGSGWTFNEPVACSGCNRSGHAHVSAFRAMWDSLNARRGHNWDANPWVWCLSFRVLAPRPGDA